MPPPALLRAASPAFYYYSSMQPPSPSPSTAAYSAFPPPLLPAPAADALFAEPHHSAGALDLAVAEAAVAAAAQHQGCVMCSPLAPLLPVALPAVQAQQHSASVTAYHNGQQGQPQLQEPQPAGAPPRTRTRARIVISGLSLGLPSNPANPGAAVFSPDNLPSLFRGDLRIQPLTDADTDALLSMRPFALGKPPAPGAARPKQYYSRAGPMLRVHARLTPGAFDLCAEYGVPAFVAEALDASFTLAIAAGFEALHDAGIPVLSEDIVDDSAAASGADAPPPRRRRRAAPLPEPLQRDTGVIFASSFPGLESLAEEAEAVGLDRARAAVAAALAERAADPREIGRAHV